GADAVVAMSKFKEYLEETPTECGKTIMFAYYRGTLVGLYSGPQVDRRRTLESLTPTLNDAVKSSSNTRHAVEACNKRSAKDVFGLVVDPTGDFAAVQAVVKSWNEGLCVSSTKTKNIDTAFAWGSKTASNAETQSPMRSTKAKVLADGVCASYETKMGDICDVIAKQYGISIDDLGKWNKKTWGWDGCDNLQPFVRICISAGNPPMPASVWNAECGPTRNDTAPPQNGEELADLNPCPLNVCCNRWGMCGLTDEYCLKSKSSTGNPGTGQKGEAGCISNCERTLTNNNKGPQKFRKIGYFEAWNYDRPCLNMHVKDIDKSYSHIHFSFAEISKNLSVVIPSNVQQQFQSFLNGTNLPAKKIIAFGGWAFSNEGTGTGLFRKAVAPNNRQAFANRVVRFVVDNKLDGVDFDWEYPGATDIDGSEPGQESDGENYFQFLKLVREKLPKEKTVSIAAPASFWYLKSFPIKKMAGVLDYIIYMTYDLHGKWDVGSKWASPGCPAGNCLRSHVNSTETMDSLIMITRAGVESHKVVVGVSSYGRSFKMSSSTCRGSQCTFLGGRNDSKAKKGRCTDTAGYISDFEINEIISKGGAIKKWYDEPTDSDYLVYEGDEWVAYMSKLTKSRRMRDYMKLNFGGTTDWAIDLQEDY
ncbi:glycoside hydrolase superfamily, partial [Fusarium flagelliforme]|uniref:glycoside hydrolase superfamily n=1 Tax=Fusarium flagelliforme TaxID=2675880 RepID=UPI001E8D8346